MAGEFAFTSVNSLIYAVVQTDPPLGTPPTATIGLFSLPWSTPITAWLSGKTDAVRITLRHNRDFARYKLGYYQLYENKVPVKDDVVLWKFKAYVKR